MQYKGINNNSKLLSRRKDLRNHLSPIEAILWVRLKSSMLGYKFRRQHSIGPFIVDFYCPECKLVVELDGQVHNNDAQYKYDQSRTKFLKTKGLTVIRFTGHDVYKNLEGVLKQIKNFCEGANHPGPSGHPSL